MNNTKLTTIFLTCIALLVGCSDDAVEQASIERPPEKNNQIQGGANNSNSKPSIVSGLIRGQPFQVEQALVTNGTLTLRQGKEFIPDRSVLILLFEKNSLENKEFQISPKTGFGSPHLHLGIKKENETLPDVKLVMKGYELDLKFGKANDLGIPFSIKLVFMGDAKTDIKGEYFATFMDIQISDGQIDLTHDSFDTLRYVSQQYLKEKYENIQFQYDFGGSYQSHADKNHPKAGFIGYETVLDGGKPSLAKIQLYKDEKGWRVVNQLDEDQIPQAHPITEYTANNPRGVQKSQAQMVAALELESNLNTKDMMPKVRSTTISCHMARTLDKANCRAVYGVRQANEIVCESKNYLLVRSGEKWKIESEISDDERLNSKGELVVRKLFGLNCS